MLVALWFLGMENKPRSFPYRLAIGIPHQLQAANLPCLAASMCLIPSFCLSRRWNVNHAPTLGLCPKGEIQLDCPGSPFSMCCSYFGSLSGVRVYADWTRLRQTGCSAFLCFRWGLRLLRCVLQGLLHVANQFVGFVVAAFGQDRIKNAGEFAA